MTSKLYDFLSTAAVGLIAAGMVAAPAHASIIAVPEPTTLGLLAAGAAAVAVAVRVGKRK